MDKFKELYPVDGIAVLIEESGGKLTKEQIKKKHQVDQLRRVVVGDHFRYFDDSSYRLLDLKIEVLTALKEGKVPAQIERYYDVFEMLPPEEQIWD